MIISLCRNAWQHFLILAFAVGVQIPLGAETFYVDNAAVGANDGHSWKSAWTSFSSIVWGSGGVDAGDTILVSGGSDNKVYKDQLVVGASGGVDKPITIAASTDLGHDGRPIIQHNAGTSPIDQTAIVVYGRTHIVIEGLAAQSSPYVCLWIDYSSTDIVVREGHFTAEGRAAVVVRSSTRITIAENYITSIEASIPNQADGIYFQDGELNVVEGNVINIRNTNPDQHCDLIQTFRERSLTVRNNLMFYGADSSSNKNGLFLSTSPGIHQVYNNIILGAPSSSSTTCGYIPSGVVGGVMLFNNYIWSGKGIVANLQGSSVIVNNIFESSEANILVTYDGPKGDDIRTNLYYRPTAGNIIMSGSGERYSLFDWQATGADVNSINADPGLETDYYPTPLSPVVDAGTDLSMYFVTDHIGQVRGANGKWDIGPYEYVSGGAHEGLPPAAPSGLRIE